MTTKILSQFFLGLIISFNSAHAQIFDLLKLHCFRQEQLGEQSYLSEIHFRKAGTLGQIGSHASFGNAPDLLEGEVLSYSIHGTDKKYVSGYNLYSISYHDQIISGLTGDAMTGSDGSFTLVKLQKNNGDWKFSYTDTNHFNIDADFKCKYLGFEVPGL